MQTQRNCRIEPLENRRLLSWTTVDELVLPDPGFGGGVSADPADMTSDSAGGVYAAGFTLEHTTNDYTAVLRYKSGASAQWQTLVALKHPLGKTAHFSDVAVAPTGEVYLSGRFGIDLVIWKGTWNPEGTALSLSVVDNDPFGDDFQDYDDLAIDSTGNVFAVGRRKSSNGPSSSKIYHWIVRKQTGGQGAFVTVDDYVFNKSDTEANAITMIPSGPNAGVYVVGRGGGSFETSAGACWIVRKSTNGGSTWSNVDGFQLEPSKNAPASAHAVTVHEDGTLYVAGSVSTGVRTGGTPNKPIYTYTHRWYSRSSSNGGVSWTNHDVYPASAAVSQSNSLDTATAVTTDLTGNVYVAGRFGSQSIVRTNDGGSWSTSDSYEYNGLEKSSMTRDSSGDVYVAGATYGPAPEYDAIWWVRSMTPAASASSGGGGTGGSIFADSRISHADDDTL